MRTQTHARAAHAAMSDELKYAGAPTATVSSLKSEQSTQHLLAAQQLKEQEARAHSRASRSAEAGSEVRAGRPQRRALVLLGLAQVVLGAALLSAGALAVVKGAALARVGAGLWAGCVAVVAGVVGVLAGINDCYGLHSGGSSGSPLLTAFLALSLLCLASGNSAAVLAATGLQRDWQRQPGELATFQEEQAAWRPVLANIAVLAVSVLHCAVAAASVYQLASRVCPCLRRKPPFDHNQFDPTFKAVAPYVIHVDEKGAEERRHDLARDLEGKLHPEHGKLHPEHGKLHPEHGKLHPEHGKKKKEEAGEFDSANSKEKLVTRWLGHHHSTEGARAGGARAERPERVERVERIERIERGERRGVRKQRARPAPLVLLPAHPAHPAHPASTLGRVPAACVMLPPRYATLPLPPPAPLYYPLHDTRMRRRRSPRTARRARREHGRERDSQLARSLERIHRKRRAERERLSDAELKQTYTGLDRAYAEQFIAVIDESRHAAELHDSLATTNTSDSTHSAGKDV